MDYIKFETLDFPSNQEGGLRYSRDMISVTKTGGVPSVLRFNSFLNDTLCQFKFMQVKRNPLTGQIYLVFNNDDGLKVVKRNRENSKDNTHVVTCRQLCLFLAKKYGEDEKGHIRIKISDNISNDSRYATYEIIGKAEI